MNPTDEPRAIAERYTRRAPHDDRYSFLRPEVCLGVQERQRVILQLLRQKGITDLAQLRLLELGCGTGANLLELLRMGCAPPALGGHRAAARPLCPSTPYAARSRALAARRRLAG